MTSKEYQKIYRESHKEKRKEYMRKYQSEHKIELRAYDKVYAKNNREKIKNYQEKYHIIHKKELCEKKTIYMKEYRKTHRKQRSNYNKKYYQNHIEQAKEYADKYRKSHRKSRRQYINNKLRIDINFKLAQNLRKRINKALKGISKSKSTINLLGCSIKELRLYLESKFKIEMNWSNYGYYGWHVDHIRPCASFNLSKESEQKKCFHYTNFQPLWAIDNIKKGKNNG